MRLSANFVNHVAAIRNRSGMTQEQLARAANVSRQTIVAIEGGNYNPSTELALRLAFLLAVSMNELFELTEESKAELRSRLCKITNQDTKGSSCADN